MPIKQKNLIKN